MSGAPAGGPRLIVCVGANGSRAGKTTVACLLLSRLSGWAAIKVTRCHSGACPRATSCGVCSGLETPYRLTEMTPENDLPGKDTARLRQAGASRVLWLVTSPDAAAAGLADALKRLDGLPGVIIEGNTAASLPNLALLIAVHRPLRHLSASAAAVMAAADVILESDTPQPSQLLRRRCGRIADMLCQPGHSAAGSLAAAR